MISVSPSGAIIHIYGHHTKGTHFGCWYQCNYCLIQDRPSNDETWKATSPPYTLEELEK